MSPNSHQSLRQTPATLCRNQNRKVQDAYFEWCEAMRLPFIHIDTKETHASITMDLISADLKGQKDLELRDWVKALFEREGMSGSWVSAGYYNHCDDLALDRVEAVAAKLWAIGNAMIGRERRRRKRKHVPRRIAVLIT